MMNKFFSIELAAKMCHAASLAWEQHHASPGSPPILTKAWDEDSDVRKDNFRKMVERFAVGCDEAYVHDLTVSNKKSSGWGYGARSDVHDPYLIPYEQLALRMKLRYTLYRNIVKSFELGETSEKENSPQQQA